MKQYQPTKRTPSQVSVPHVKAWLEITNTVTSVKSRHLELDVLHFCYMFYKTTCCVTLYRKRSMSPVFVFYFPIWEVFPVWENHEGDLMGAIVFLKDYIIRVLFGFVHHVNKLYVQRRCMMHITNIYITREIAGATANMTS